MESRSTLRPYLLTRTRLANPQRRGTRQGAFDGEAGFCTDEYHWPGTARSLRRDFGPNYFALSRMVFALG